MTEVFVDERGVLRVPAKPHTCDSHHELQNLPCLACAEMVAFWQSFDAMPINVRIMQPVQLCWDMAHDCQVFEVEPEEVWS